MPETEIVEQAIQDLDVINVPPVAAVAVLSLAAYGGFDLTRKAVGKVRKFRQIRKARQTVTPQPSETPSQ